MDGIEDFDQYWPYVKGANAFDAYKSGDWNKALLSMGQSAVFADSVQPMEQIYDTLIDEAAAALERLHGLKTSKGVRCISPKLVCNSKLREPTIVASVLLRTSSMVTSELIQ